MTGSAAAAPVRIGVDIATLRPPFTGIANYEIQLLRRLLPQFPQADFLGFRIYRWQPVDAALLDTFTAGAVPFVRTAARGLRYSSLAHLARNALRQAAFTATADRQALSFYHAFSYRPPGRLGAPVVPVVYDLSTIRYPETHPAARIRWMEPLGRICQAAPVVHTISAFTASEIEREFGIPRERIVVAEPGVNPLFCSAEEADPTVLARFGLKRHAYALTVSTIEPRKNLKTLVEGYSRLAPALRQTMPLVVAGARGWGEADLPASLRALEAEGSLRFLGYVADPDLRSLYAGARLMLYPSLYEGFGMPITEAMASGTPVVASNAASMPEAGGPLSHYVAPLDAEGWTAALRDAAEGPAPVDPAARQARRDHAAGFSWERSAGVVAALYRRLL